jgi:radical SAM protein with 4Fe4S-binding SPASM domain
VPDWVVVNRNGAVLLARCDGSATVEEIVAGSPDGEGLLSQAHVLFDEALRRGVLVDGDGQGLRDAEDRSGGARLTHISPQRTRVDRGHPSLLSMSGALTQDAARSGGAAEVEGAGLRGELERQRPVLGVVHLQLTNQCNLHCSYCYAQSGKPSEVLSWEELESIASHVAAMSGAVSHSVEYVLSGGEPLLHPRALEFAERVKAAGNTVHLLTNGTLIDERNAERIAAVADLVKISLDGSSEMVHAATRGKNNFARAVRAAELLVGLGVNVVVAMTVTRENRGDIPAMVERFGSRLALQPLFKAGRGREEDRLALTGAEYYAALAAVDGVAPMGAVAKTLRSVRGRGARRCAMAEREISISETGDVYPCQLLHADEFRAGNIRERSLAEIYYESPVFERLRKVNVDTLGKCSGCELRYICGGACRARDFYEMGSVEEVGEFCAYEREAFLAGIFASVELQLV